MDFFENLGFTTEFHSFMEMQNELTSPQKLGFTREEVSDKLLASAAVIIFKLKE